MKLWFLVCLTITAALGQGTAPVPDLNAAEKNFQEAMANVTLSGYFTSGDSAELHEDHYGIDRVSKIKEDTWMFEAHIQFNKKDMKISLPLPVKFAGDTPMITLTNYTVPGMGSFSARILFYDGAYAGTWSNGAGHGGKMFGKIVKNDAPPAKQ